MMYKVERHLDHYGIFNAKTGELRKGFNKGTPHVKILKKCLALNNPENALRMFDILDEEMEASDKIEINKDVLFRLVFSHSNLAKAEYDRNPSYNSDSPSHIAEHDLIIESQEHGWFDEFMDYMNMLKEDEV